MQKYAAIYSLKIVLASKHKKKTVTSVAPKLEHPSQIKKMFIQELDSD